VKYQPSEIPKSGNRGTGWVRAIVPESRQRDCW
jgi:hypothetical protein